ncbi:unnamed protein product [Nippostrongylus brasiliensis]|uniref:Lig_chan-Glu_bd domain-containing protein n=1 Tax=Nippostrongylus brasiliensis TaxID=27835 RepID=A0A0N4XEX1_NIPBR|nr:unnamed protein product [Nippostrongylus brasiliensis]
MIPVEKGNSTKMLFKQFVSPMQVMKSGNWSSDGTAFVTELMNASLDQGVGIGFHTTREDWKNIIDAPGFAGGAVLWSMLSHPHILILCLILFSIMRAREIMSFETIKKKYEQLALLEE